MVKNYDFTFFLPKICMTAKLRKNASVIFFMNRHINSKKIILKILTFYPKKNANKNVAFLNVLSVVV